MSTTLSRAKVATALQRSSHEVAQELEQALRALPGPLPNHRVSQIVNALAWHEDRTGPGKRLEEGARAIARLLGERGQGAGPTELTLEGRLYARLLARLGLRAELAAMRRQAEEARDERQQALATAERQRDRREIRRLRGEIPGLVRNADLYRKAEEAASDPRRWDTEAKDSSAGSPATWALIATRALPEEERAEQGPTARLLAALHVLQVLHTLQRSRRLREQIGEKGEIRWTE